MLEKNTRSLSLAFISPYPSSPIVPFAMLSLSFVTLSLFGLALASPTQRAENGLTVALTPSSKSVDSISDLKLTAAVTNNDAEDVKVLNYGSILDTALPTRSFSVTKNGAATNFTGIKVNCLL